MISFAVLVIIIAAWNSGINAADTDALAYDSRGADPAICNTNDVHETPCGIGCVGFTKSKCKQANPGVSQTTICDTDNGLINCEGDENSIFCTPGNDDVLYNGSGCIDPYPPPGS